MQIDCNVIKYDESNLSVVFWQLRKRLSLFRVGINDITLHREKHYLHDLASLRGPIAASLNT